MANEQHDAIIARETRKREKITDRGKAAIDGMRDHIAKAMKDDKTNDNVNRQFLNARQGGEPMKPRAGFGDDGEVITGWDKPWDRS